MESGLKVPYTAAKLIICKDLILFFSVSKYYLFESDSFNGLLLVPAKQDSLYLDFHPLQGKEHVSSEMFQKVQCIGI